MPANEDASNFELQNEASTGSMSGVGSGGVVVPSTRMQDNPANFHRGMFALMASFDWNAGKFSEHPSDQALKAEAMELLKLPPHLSSQFNQQKMTELIENLEFSNRRGDTNVEESSRSADYVRNLIKMSQARFKR
jgi:hypothetical protein